MRARHYAYLCKSPLNIFGKFLKVVSQCHKQDCIPIIATKKAVTPLKYVTTRVCMALINGGIEIACDSTVTNHVM